MNTIFYIFMEEYKKHLFYCICGYTTIEETEEHIKDDTRFTINRNEEGKIHSRYLEDRYEPAMIHQAGYYIENYYLFDGDIKDCTHPFCVTYDNGEIIDIMYYSSERIKNGEPIYIDSGSSIYNSHKDEEILNGYRSGYVNESNNLEKITLLCDEMEELFTFKFAD